LEPKEPVELIKAYLKAKSAACKTLGTKQANDDKGAGKVERKETCKRFAQWSESLMDYLKRRMNSLLL
jgi:hypothetical protein